MSARRGETIKTNKVFLERGKSKGKKDRKDKGQEKEKTGVRGRGLSEKGKKKSNDKQKGANTSENEGKKRVCTYTPAPAPAIRYERMKKIHPINSYSSYWFVHWIIKEVQVPSLFSDADPFSQVLPLENIH